MKVFESAALFLQAKSSFLVNEGKKMGQWPIFCGASLRLPRLALPLSSVSLPPSPSPSLRAFQQISIGSARRLIGHEAACEEKRRASSRPLIPYASSISPLGLSTRWFERERGGAEVGMEKHGDGNLTYNTENNICYVAVYPKGDGTPRC